MANKPRTIGWYEHHSGNSNRARLFYQEICGWEMTPTTMETENGAHDDWTAMNGEDAVFGIIQSFPGFEGYKGWLPYFIVDNIFTAKAKAESIGGTEIHHISTMEGYGTWCAMRDPEGVPFAMFQPEKDQ